MAAQVAREIQHTSWAAVDIDKLARTIFAFEPVSHPVMVQGVHPGTDYQCVFDWIMKLSEQPSTVGDKVAVLRTFVAGLLPDSNLNESLLNFSTRFIAQRGVPHEVPLPYVDEVDEAARVLSASPKASAALARRCLQQLLREKAGVQPSSLDAEIQQVLDSRALPSYLAEAIDAVRVVGNFAAHPIKSKNTGAIIDVEPGEAEWLLDVLEGLFDFYFVQPIRLQARKEALNEKLKAAGKPLLKSAPKAAD